MENLTLNERFVKLGKIPISQPVGLNGTVHITVHGESDNYHFECVKVEQKNNQDGTYDEIYVLKHAH